MCCNLCVHISRGERLATSDHFERCGVRVLCFVVVLRFGHIAPLPNPRRALAYVYYVQGTESGAAGARSAPVQFEADPAEADPFGLDAFLKDAKSSKKK